MKVDKANGAYYYSLAAKMGDGWSTIWLRDLLNDGDVKNHYDTATLQEWKTLCENYSDSETVVEAGAGMFVNTGWSRGFG